MKLLPKCQQERVNHQAPSGLDKLLHISSAETASLIAQGKLVRLSSRLLDGRHVPDTRLKAVPLRQGIQHTHLSHSFCGDHHFMSQ